MAALEQYGAIAVKRDGAGGGQHLFPAVDGTAGEHFGLLPVGGDDLGQREQLLPQGADSVRFHQAGARGGHHDGVHHDVPGLIETQPLGDRRNERGGRYHPDLDGVGADVGKHRVDLLCEEGRGNFKDAGNAGGVLGRQRGDGAHGKHTVQGHGFEISLDSGASAAIASCDG